MESELSAENQRLRQRVEELERRLEEWKREYVIPMLLQRLLSSTHRDAAFEQLLSFGDEVVPILIALLEKPLKTLKEMGVVVESWFIEDLQLQAVDGLVKLKAKDAVKPLINLLKSQKIRLRLKAIDGLVELEAKEAIEPLLSLLDSQDSLLCMKAIDGLVRLKAKDATKPLLNLLKSQNARLRLKALWALERLGELSEEALLQIIKLLNDADLRVREEAFALLGDLGNPAAIPLIIPFLGDLRLEGGFRAAEHAAKALESLGVSEIVKAFRRIIDDGDLNALEILRPYRKPVIEALIRALDSYFSEHIENAARALKAWNAVEALPKLRAKLRWAFFTLSDKSRQACEDAVRHLENFSRLPAPVSPTQIQIEGLPRPANPSDINTENLPSPAKAPKGETNDLD